MAINVHVAIIGMVNVSNTDSSVVYSKTQNTLGQVMKSGQEPRILEDATNPNTTGNPAIKEYIELEAVDNYQVQHISQTYIITYEVTP